MSYAYRQEKLQKWQKSTLFAFKGCAVLLCNPLCAVLYACTYKSQLLTSNPKSHHQSLSWLFHPLKSNSPLFFFDHWCNNFWWCGFSDERCSSIGRSVNWMVADGSSLTIRNYPVQWQRHKVLISQQRIHTTLSAISAISLARRA